jgi:hypothetical protein
MMLRASRGNWNGLHWLEVSRPDAAAQALAKRIFNDDMPCNPCKVLPDLKSCVEHKMDWRGVAT